MNAFARPLAGKVDNARISHWPVGTLVRVALVARSADLWAFEGERAQEKARLQRMFITIELPRTHMPRPANPQFPEVNIVGAIANRPTPYRIGPLLILRHSTANFSTK